MNYTVTWVIDIFDADTPEEAARKALKIQRDPESLATCFIVNDADDITAPQVTIDLEN